MLQFKDENGGGGGTIFMSQVRDNSAPKIILGARSLAIPRQACIIKAGVGSSNNGGPS